MTRYEIPDEPHGVPTVWTIDQYTGEPVPHRYNTTTKLWVDPRDYRRSWRELLEIGPVDDVHPDFADLPAPWRVDAEGDLEHAKGRLIIAGADACRDTLTLIARAVNAYAERLVGESDG